MHGYHRNMDVVYRLANRLRYWLACAVLVLAPGIACGGEVAAFDLIGPRVEVTVTRAGRTLPIAEVPNLQSGDRVWIHPALPNDQRAHYLMVVAFLRGATNPPPDAWFIRAETWGKSMREEGIVVTVPAGAQQALIFLAPQTGGDFATLRSAVQGKPGAFVRAAQDLQLISQTRARLEKYLAAIRESGENDAKALHERALILARSLSIKVDEQCFSRPPLQQASCLMQNSDQLVLDDGHGESMVSTLTQGAGSDLIGAISTTKAAGAGAYSPYVGVVVDLARLMENLHTAKYQYISALALPQGDELHLRLNSPPSFHAPQSVIVIGLPLVQPALLPALQPVPPDSVNCAQNPKLVMGAEGAPLVFSSELAHDLMLHLEDKAGKSIEIPVAANALLGGFVPTAPLPQLDSLPLAFSGKVRGQWGFELFEGPVYTFQRSDASAKWIIPDDHEAASIAGHDRTLHLHSQNNVCVEEISFRGAKGEVSKTTWKPSHDELEVKLPLEQAPPGESALLVKQYGLGIASELPLHVYAEACRLDGFEVHAGDTEGLLKGSCLDQVVSLETAGVRWSGRSTAKDGLQMSAENAEKLVLHEKQALAASVLFKDGRRLDLHGSVLPPRPKLGLMSKVVDAAASPIHLDSADDLPMNGRLQFRLKSEQPTIFGKAEKVEVASDDGFYHTELTFENGGLMRQSAQTVMATLEIGKDIAASSFGALRFRPLSEEGIAGDWQPLATLVRLPELSELRCPGEKTNEACTLIGNNLFLIEAIASDAQFQDPTPVSENAMEAKIEVPRPKGKLLYLKLRDDPSVIHTLEMPVKKDTPVAKAPSKEETPEKPEKPAPFRAKSSDSGDPPAQPLPQ